MPTLLREQPEFLVVYDLTDDRERRHVDAVLKGYGFRVQKSVYECRLSRADRSAVQRALERLTLRTGHVRIYRVYGGTECCVIGNAPPAVDDDAAYVF